MPLQSQISCIACGCATYRMPDTNTVFCSARGCTLTNLGMNLEQMGFASALIQDAYRSGYQSALDNMTAQLTELEKVYGDRRSNRSNPHETKAAPG